MMTHSIPPITLDEDLAYVLGVIGPGDGFTFRDGISLETIDREFAEEFRQRVEKVTKLKCRFISFYRGTPNRKPTYRVILFSRQFRDFLAIFGVSFRHKEWRVPDVIIQSQEGVKAAYLRAFFDSQASVHKCICIEVKNPQGLREIQRMLNDFHLRTYFVRRNNRENMCKLWITGRSSLERFHSKIGFTIKRKHEKLEKWLQKCPRERAPTREVNKLIPKVLQLRGLGFSYGRIARSLGMNKATVWVRLKKLNSGPPEHH